MMFQIFIYHFICNISGTPTTNSYCPNWRPQYLFFNSGNSICNFLDERPFNNFTRVRKSCDRLYSTCIWIWFFDTNPFKICTPSASHICFLKDFTNEYFSTLNPVIPDNITALTQKKKLVVRKCTKN